MHQIEGQLPEAALSLINVTYEVLPFNLDERRAMDPGTPQVHTETDSIGIEDASINLVHHLHGAASMILGATAFREV